MAKGTQDADSVAEKWRRNYAAAQTAYKDGVMAVTESPTAKAAKAKNKYLAGVQKAVDSGRYEEGCLSVSTEDWKAACVDKGMQRMSAGAQQAMSKQRQFYAQLLPHTKRVSEEIARMPDMTDTDAEERAVAAIRKMREFRFRKRG